MKERRFLRTCRKCKGTGEVVRHYGDAVITEMCNRCLHHPGKEEVVIKYGDKHQSV